MSTARLGIYGTFSINRKRVCVFDWLVGLVECGLGCLFGLLVWLIFFVLFVAENKDAYSGGSSEQFLSIF